MKRSLQIKLIGLLVIIVMIGGLAVAYRVHARNSAFQTTLAWARVNPLPTSAMRIELDIEGSMFTREFYVTFTAPMADINAWIAASPGTKDVAPEPDGYGSLVYKIQPGGGAQFAEVSVNPEMQTVAIHAFWS